MDSELLKILEEINPDVDYAATSGLVTDRLLTSLELIMLITELCDAYEIEIPPEDITPEQFDSVAAIWELIQRLRDEA